jgi:hypothetical protein
MRTRRSSGLLDEDSRGYEGDLEYPRLPRMQTLVLLVRELPMNIH